MLEITDLVNSRNLVELQESEMKSIRGGDGFYGICGTMIYKGHLLHECV